MTGKPDYFETFCKVSKAFGTTVGKEEILNLIVESSIETMNGKAACLFLSDEEHDVFVPVAQKGLSENYLHAKPMKAKRVVNGILTEGGYFSVYDAGSDPRLENHELKKAEGIASILAVPVMVKDKAIGVLSLYTDTPREFTEDEIKFQSALADHGGMAVERARLFERIRRNSEMFYDLSSSINSSLDIKKIMHILTAEIADAFGMQGVTIRLMNSETKTLDLMASYGLSEKYLNKGPLMLDKGVGLALKGETVIISDIKNDDRVPYPAATEKERIASIMFVPIKSGEDVIGIMKLVSSVPQDFDEYTIKLVEGLAHQGGLAIQNASLYLMLQEDKRNLEQEIWSHRSWF